MSSDFVFTSESVSEGHPDKIADQISDRVVDHFLSADPHSHVACETMLHAHGVIIAGEYRSSRPYREQEIVALARQCLIDIGYDSQANGYDGNQCPIQVAMVHQSEEIDEAVDKKSLPNAELGAGDQGIMFGYACTDTDVLMPMPIELAHRLMRRQAALRRSGELAWLKPDAKAQVSVRYHNREPICVESVTVSTQHAAEVNPMQLRQAVIEAMIEQVIPLELRSAHIRYFVNPSGSFVKGGPSADCGLTGRKIIVDTYGGMGRHGGGAFSGKDPTKVDRSGAYAMRHVAKNVIAAGLADCCEVQVSYAIGKSEPISLMVDSFGTGKIADTEIEQRIRHNFDLRPQAIIDSLQLRHTPYGPLASYGHFGRTEGEYLWENTDKHEALKS